MKSARGGLGTKLHAAVDALGNPVRLLAGPGQQNDMAQAHNPIVGLHAEHVIADRAYDADSLMDAIFDQGGKPVIPPRRHRKHQHRYNKTIYKERNIIERFFAKLKHFRRVATRYDKLLVNFLGFVKIAAIALCIK